MNEQRNFLLAITLSIIVLLFWQYFVGSKQIDDRSPEQVSAENNTAAIQDLSNIPLPSDPVENDDISIQAPGGLSNSAYAETRRIKINTENLSGSISLTGAKLDDIQLKNYRESLSEDSDLVHIFRPYSSQNPYYAHQGWVSGSDIKIKLPDDKSVWEIIEGEELSVNQPIKLRWDNGEGLVFTKKYIVDENYLFTVQQSIENNTDNDLTIYPYSLISRKGLPEDYQNFFVLHEGYIGVLGDQGEKKADYSDIAEETESFENISCEIIDLRTVRPMDHETILNSVKKTNRLVILEEAWPFGNVATEITYQVQSQAFDYLDAPIEKINTADTPAPYSPVLLKEWLPNSEDVIKAVKKVLYK